MYNKLDALRTLSNAYWHLRGTQGDDDALALVDWRFNAVRRSLDVHDLRPRVCNEGYNGRMPSHF